MGSKIENKKKNEGNWRRYLFEFLSIFIGVTMAFTLERCNENRRDRVSENKTLIEISNGLHSDLEDLELNMKGHHIGIKACHFFRKAIRNEWIDQDSVGYYYHYLLRDFISCLLYTSPSPRDATLSRMPSSA